MPVRVGIPKLPYFGSRVLSAGTDENGKCTFTVTVDDVPRSSSAASTYAYIGDKLAVSKGDGDDVKITVGLVSFNEEDTY